MRDEQRLVGAEGVKAHGVLANAFIAALANFGEDLVHDSVHLGGGRSAALLDLADSGVGPSRVFAEGFEYLHEAVQLRSKSFDAVGATGAEVRDDMGGRRNADYAD